MTTAEILALKREEVATYIRQEIENDPAVQSIVVIGSLAKGTARADSDIDAIVFLDPFDLYAVPAEAKWEPGSGTFHSIFTDVPEAIQLDLKRVDLRVWSDPAFVWPESICAELSEGWVAFDRFGRITPLIAERTAYSDIIRQSRLDDALIHLDWLLSEAKTGRPWLTHGATAAHYRLNSAFDYLVQSLFAYNRHWRTLRSRELTDLLRLSWLPNRFEEGILEAMGGISAEFAGYQQRVATLTRFFDELRTQCSLDPLYQEDDIIGEAFVRQNDEPGRAWNMASWEQRHRKRHS